MIFDRLREIDLQINIKKCEFDIKKIMFLKVIISKTNLRINSNKVEIIIN